MIEISFWRIAAMFLGLVAIIILAKLLDLFKPGNNKFNYVDKKDLKRHLMRSTFCSVKPRRRGPIMRQTLVGYGGRSRSLETPTPLTR